MALRPVADYVRLLDAVHRFEQVGGVEDEAVSAVKDWAETQTYICNQLVWLNFRNAISNRHREVWRQAYSDGRQEQSFNEVVDVVKGKVQIIRWVESTTT